MASSSSTSLTWRYHLFASLFRPDVRTRFFSYIHTELKDNGISMFDDQGIARGQTIAPELTQAIKESRISIVVLSKNYASSSWCLDELLEILKCKEDIGQIVMTVFYGVDPSHVRNQTGDFGIAFNETCARKTEEERRIWSQALNAVGNIAGEHFLNSDDELEMIDTIVSDVSNICLQASPRESKLSKDYASSGWFLDELKQMEHFLNRDIESAMNEKISRDVLLEFHEPSIRSKKSRYSTGMAFLVVINLLLEIASAVADQLSSIRKPYFARISLLISILSVILSILDLTFKIGVHKARFQCKWPMPWFYYPSRGYKRIFGSFTDTVLFFCVVGQFIVSTINCRFTERRQDSPIKVSVWPLFFAIGMAGSKFMEKPLISKEN